MEQITQTRQKNQATSAFTPRSGLMQRQCACGGKAGIDDLCEQCRSQRLSIQWSTRNSVEPSQLASSGHNILGLPHQPLDTTTQTSGGSRFGHDFSQVPVYAAVPEPIQAKLSVSQPGDKYEQEADQVAEQVTRMPASETVQNSRVSDHPSPIHIQWLSSQSEKIHRQPEEGEEEEETLQAKEIPGRTPTVTPELQTHIHSLVGGGQPLPESTREFMESRFRYDFSRIRIHTNERAAETARAVSALAYTVGRDVVFGAGQYAPQTSEGRKLLAHELTHVVQQNNHSGFAQRGETLIQRKVSPKLEAMRKKFKFWVTKDNVHDVLEMLSELKNDKDLKDTLNELGEEFVDKIFSHIGEKDKQNQAQLLGRIRQQGPGRTFLAYYPKAIKMERTSHICGRKGGAWELAKPFDSLKNLVEEVEKSTTQFPLKKLGILAHGNAPGVIILGNTELNVANIRAYTSEFQKLAKHLTSDANIYIYGCISGREKRGSVLLKQLSLLLPGRKVIGFNTYTYYKVSSVREDEGGACVNPIILSTSVSTVLTAEGAPEYIRSEVESGRAKTYPPDENSPTAKVAQGGEIKIWPKDPFAESPEFMDSTEEKEIKDFLKYKK